MKLETYNTTTPFQLNSQAVQLVLQAEEQLGDVFHKLEKIAFANQCKVLQAFQREGIAQRHFASTTGYGYDDIGRDALDRVFAYALDAQDALVRPQFVNGTHALFCALAGMLRPGESMLAITGKPYDTLEEAIGITGNAPASLKERGISYREVPLNGDQIDIQGVLAALDDPNIRVAYAQRSRGYAWRNAISLEALSQVFSAIHKKRPDVAILVDNCYGEFCQAQEPTAIGADLIMGSLIKNPGGGLAPTGGYIAGKREAVERVQHILTVPGMGREVGSYASSYAPFFQGLFLAPHITLQSLKSAALFAKIFELVGMTTLPCSHDDRSDIIQSVQFKTKEALISFCQSIQKAAPVDSFVMPEPWDMPGYSHQVIMAAGAFVQGASIELSADGPIREPYTAYIQGALTYAHGKIGAMFALDGLIKSGEISIPA